MDHRCYQCGATVEDGTAFCRQCNAPQIRVSTVESASAEDIQPQQQLSPRAFPELQPTVRLRISQALPAACLGLLIASVLSLILRGALGFGMLAAGFLSVFFYRRKNPLFPLTVGFGARLGALSGTLGFGILALISAAATSMFHYGGEIHQLILKAVQQYASRNPAPEMQQILDFYASPQGFILMLALGSVMMFALFVALSSMGGMIGAAVFRTKKAL